MLNGAGLFHALLFVNVCTREPCGCVDVLKQQVSSPLATTFLPLFPYWISNIRWLVRVKHKVRKGTILRISKSI